MINDGKFKNRNSNDANLFHDFLKQISFIFKSGRPNMRKIIPSYPSKNPTPGVDVPGSSQADDIYELEEEEMDPKDANI